jgi:hypothetical protein
LVSVAIWIQVTETLKLPGACPVGDDGRSEMPWPDTLADAVQAVDKDREETLVAGASK